MYFPYLKAKQNEFLALRNCSDRAFGNIIPFFDIPRGTDDDEARTRNNIKKAKVYLERLLKVRDLTFYLDVYDIAPTIRPDSAHVYEYVLDQFDGYSVIPVLGLDREDEHNDAVLNREEKYSTVAIRLQVENLETPKATVAAINMLISDFKSKVSFDVILDFRVLDEKYAAHIANAVSIIEKLSNNDLVEVIVITGSSIPPVITELCKPESCAHFKKFEVALFEQVCHQLSHGAYSKLHYGDYTVVSPNYSDSSIPVGLMRTVQTPKIIYGNESKSIVIRGGALQSKGDAQFFNLAATLTTSGIFRGKTFSGADTYIDDVANRLVASCGNPSKWTNITIEAHLEYFSHIDLSINLLRKESA